MRVLSFCTEDQRSTRSQCAGHRTGSSLAGSAVPLWGRDARDVSGVWNRSQSPNILARSICPHYILCMAGKGNFSKMKRMCPCLLARPWGRRRLCRACHAKWARQYRTTLPPSPAAKERRRRTNARQAAQYAKDRGQLVEGPCLDCGKKADEMHHTDYAKPLDVQWLCRRCHRERHSVPSRLTVRPAGREPGTG